MITKSTIVALSSICCFVTVCLLFTPPAQAAIWQVQSIDTMKTSRDRTLYDQHNPAFQKEITAEMKTIKKLGATHVTIDGAYDAEYLPWLRKWVKAARRENLQVWFRGNFSAWHGWFGPPGMTRDQHAAALKKFILANKDLFEDGDIFTACPECEYGGPGNPLETGDIVGYRAFMIEEYGLMQESFAAIDKDVIVNWTSMNPDVARGVLDQQTVSRMGGVITLDYFVKDVSQLEEGLDYFHTTYPQAQLVIGEFGAPIPEINGPMSPTAKALFIARVFALLASRPEVVGVNYWVGSRSATELYDAKFEVNPGGMVVQEYFGGDIAAGVVQNSLGNPLSGISIRDKNTQQTVATEPDGSFRLVQFEQSNLDFVDKTNEYRAQSSKPGRAMHILLQPKTFSFKYWVREQLVRMRRAYGLGR